MGPQMEVTVGWPPDLISKLLQSISSDPLISRLYFPKSTTTVKAKLKRSKEFCSAFFKHDEYMRELKRLELVKWNPGEDKWNIDNWLKKTSCDPIYNKIKGLKKSYDSEKWKLDYGIRDYWESFEDINDNEKRASLQSNIPYYFLLKKLYTSNVDAPRRQPPLPRVSLQGRKSDNTMIDLTLNPVDSNKRKQREPSVISICSSEPEVSSPQTPQIPQMDPFPTTKRLKTTEASTPSSVSSTGQAAGLPETDDTPLQAISIDSALSITQDSAIDKEMDGDHQRMTLLSDNSTASDTQNCMVNDDIPHPPHSEREDIGFCQPEPFPPSTPAWTPTHVQPSPIAFHPIPATPPLTPSPTVTSIQTSIQPNNVPFFKESASGTVTEIFLPPSPGSFFKAYTSKTSIRDTDNYSQSGLLPPVNEHGAQSNACSINGNTDRAKEVTKIPLKLSIPYCERSCYLHQDDCAEDVLIKLRGELIVDATAAAKAKLEDLLAACANITQARSFLHKDITEWMKHNGGEPKLHRRVKVEMAIVALYRILPILGDQSASLMSGYRFYTPIELLSEKVVEELTKLLTICGAYCSHDIHSFDVRASKSMKFPLCWEGPSTQAHREERLKNCEDYIGLPMTIQTCSSKLLQACQAALSSPENSVGFNKLVYLSAGFPVRTRKSISESLKKHGFRRSLREQEFHAALIPNNLAKDPTYKIGIRIQVENNYFEDVLSDGTQILTMSEVVKKVIKL